MDSGPLFTFSRFPQTAAVWPLPVGWSAGLAVAEIVWQHPQPPMKQTPHFIRRHRAEITPWTETCGQIRPLLEEKDEAAAEVHHLEITDAKLHYHERTDEIYYILDGEGAMQLDDETISLSEGVVVYVPRGVKHRAWGDLKVLVVCIPRGVLHDVHEIESATAGHPGPA
jgi:mannose-6-phosphate isomerase-like protein (cupin superfamily)